MDKRLIITVDFDGTIVSHRFPKIGLAAPGAFTWLKRFKELGACLILLTMRDNQRDDESKFLSEALTFCAANGVVFDYANDNPTQNKWSKSRKLYSHIHIDDTNACCPLREAPDTDRPIVDWDIVGPWVEAKLLKAKNA